MPASHPAQGTIRPANVTRIQQQRLPWDRVTRSQRICWAQSRQTAEPGLGEGDEEDEEEEAGKPGRHDELRIVGRGEEWAPSGS